MHSSCRYMEEVIESTFSLLSSNHDHCSQRAEKTLEPVHLLALLDIEATWFKKWMVRPFVFSTSSLPVSFCFRLLRSLLVPPHPPPVSTFQHGYYSRTVVLRLLERKYKSLVSDSVGDRCASPASLCTSGEPTAKKSKQAKTEMREPFCEVFRELQNLTSQSTKV